MFEDLAADSMCAGTDSDDSGGTNPSQSDLLDAALSVLSANASHDTAAFSTATKTATTLYVVPLPAQHSSLTFRLTADCPTSCQTRQRRNIVPST